MNQGDFGIGPNNLSRNTLSLKPTVALTLTRELSIVSRTTVPLVSQPDVARNTGYQTGLGDTTESLFLVPRPAAGVLWGVGPTVLLPTASTSELGLSQLALGPTAAVLMQPRPWTFGVLVGQVWSVANSSNRPDVSQLSAMYFAAFNFPGGWYVHTMPTITLNWNAGAPGNAWTVPVGGGGGKVVHVGNVPINVRVSAYWNAVRPDTVAAPSASALLEVALLLPR